jgi:CarD family transcriptional regulator
MYSVGSNVVHPCYGAGTIRQIQTKTLGETSHRYYVIRMMIGPHPMQVMVPVHGADDIGLRPVCKPSRLRKALDSCLVAPSKQDMEFDYRARKSEMQELIKTGRVEDLHGIKPKRNWLENLHWV